MYDFMSSVAQLMNVMNSIEIIIHIYGSSMQFLLLLVLKRSF